MAIDMKMRFKLVKDWHIVLRDAWSSRLIIAAGVLSGAEVVLSALSDRLPMWLLVVSGVVTCLALVSRIIVQKDLPK
jgi:hypothetical protein